MWLQDRVVAYLDGLSDEELKKESKNEARNDALSSIIKVCLEIWQIILMYFGWLLRKKTNHSNPLSTITDTLEKYRENVNDNQHLHNVIDWICRNMHRLGDKKK